jgi:hypothetical protein
MTGRWRRAAGPPYGSCPGYGGIPLSDGIPAGEWTARPGANGPPGARRSDRMMKMIDHVIIKLKKFPLIERCPSEWKGLDLYLFRDEGTVFYVGQSHCAFRRVWDHILNGYKARSGVGRFILCNWPKTMNLDVELFSSQSPEFACVGNGLPLAEEMLIRRYKPCFNDSLNQDPVSLPVPYVPTSSPIRCSRSLRKLQFQALMAVKNDEKEKWMEG